MTLLSMLIEVADDLKLPRPSAAYGGTDPLVQELVNLANIEGRELASYAPDWPVLVTEATFVTLAAAEQPALPADFRSFVPDTFFNRTAGRKINGPIGADAWQSVQSSINVTPVDYFFRIRGTSLLLTPTPPAGETCAFEYNSKNWCKSSGGTGRQAWGADTDTGILPEHIMAMGIAWRYRKNLGLPFLPDYEIYTAAWKRELAEQRNLWSLNMGVRYDDPGMPNMPWKNFQ